MAPRGMARAPSEQPSNRRPWPSTFHSSSGSIPKVILKKFLKSSPKGFLILLWLSGNNFLKRNVGPWFILWWNLRRLRERNNAWRKEHPSIVPPCGTKEDRYCIV